MNTGFQSAEFESMDINVNIGDMLFNIIIDSSFFDSSDDFSFPCHSHGTYEVHVVEKGLGELWVDGETISLSPGVCCLIAPNKSHTQKDQPGNKVYKYCMKFSVRNIKRSAFAPLIPEVQDIRNLLFEKSCLFWNDQNRILDCVKMIQNEFQSKQIGYYTMLQSSFMQLLIGMIRSIAENIQVDYEINKKNLDQKRTIIIESFFYHNYMRNAYISELAEQLGVCDRQVDRIIHRYYNRSFKTKILEARMEIAKDMLANTSDTIVSIAEKVGYALPSNFSNIFKKKIGVSPEEYRTQSGVPSIEKAEASSG